jgi:hypothetical protein
VCPRLEIGFIITQDFVLRGIKPSKRGSCYLTGSKHGDDVDSSQQLSSNGNILLRYLVVCFFISAGRAYFIFEKKDSEAV